MKTTPFVTSLNAAPAATYTFTWSTGMATVIIVSVTGTDPYTALASTQTGGAAAATSATSQTVSLSRAPGIVLLAAAVGGAPAVSDPANTTRVVSSTTPDNLVGITVWTLPMANSGTSPAVTSTWTGTTSTATGYTITRGGTTFNASGVATGYTDTGTASTSAYTYTVRTDAGSWSSATIPQVAVAACP